MLFYVKLRLGRTTSYKNGADNEKDKNAAYRVALSFKRCTSLMAEMSSFVVIKAMIPEMLKTVCAVSLSSMRSTMAFTMKVTELQLARKRL